MAPTLEGSLSLVRRALATFDLARAGLEVDLRARGLDDAEALPEHPFRDDARLVARAIDAWARDYLAIAYPSDADVAADPELAAFVAELRSSDGGRLGGVPARIETVDGVARLASFVLFTASAYHAALNYSQADFMGWVPNMPTATYDAAPAGAIADADAAWSRVLPASGVAQKQLDFMWQQSGIRDDRLGRYPRGHFRDPRVAEPLARFRAALDAAQATIEERERARLLPYPYLLPSNLTASIHV